MKIPIIKLSTINVEWIGFISEGVPENLEDTNRLFEAGLLFGAAAGIAISGTVALVLILLL